ncbi:MAG TPA: hypothetical protein DD381_00670 [Lentisphaeria bacterium]|nr:MAG: hypothetical protein A2X47_00350 [Lentisphaerae bacterium GWF2_38_69]HBM14855.1 hypothetical protein [Lentisphaeria bacterium]
MKKIAIYLVALTFVGSLSLFAEDVAASGQQAQAVSQADQTTQVSNSQTCPMMKGKKKDCGSMADTYAKKAQWFKSKADKATAKGDAKMAELLTNCSTASQAVSDQMNAVMKLKSECMANSASCPMMKKQDKSCGTMGPKECMKKAMMCEKMSQKMAKKAGAETDAAAANDKAISEMQAKMSAQYKSLAAAQETFGKAKSDLRAYKQFQKESKETGNSDDQQAN